MAYHPEATPEFVIVVTRDCDDQLQATVYHTHLGVHQLEASDEAELGRRLAQYIYGLTVEQKP